MIPLRRNGRWLFLASGILAMSCDSILGINEYDSPTAPDAGGIDATSPPDSSPGDRTDAGEAGTDAGTDASEMIDGGTIDASADSCAATVARMLASPIVPPAHWAGLDLSNGGVSNIAPGSGGLNLPPDLVGCAAYVEPAVLGMNAVPINGGYRAVGFGDSRSPSAFPLRVDTNLQSGAVAGVDLENGYTGTLAFHSRDGGAYGVHTYELAIGVLGNAPADGGSAWVDAGGGSVKRDGVDFPADWSTYTTGAGVPHASPWVNELYDGLVASFDPNEAAVADCSSTMRVLYDPYTGLLTHLPLCRAFYEWGNTVFQAFPLELTLRFNLGTNQLNGIYSDWLGARADCGTPNANLERMDYAPIGSGWIGWLGVDEYVSNPSGLTVDEANAIECNGTGATIPDNGWGGMGWGPNTELEMEYNLSTRLAYKVIAKVGYKGLLEFGDPDNNDYVFGIGVPLTKNGAPSTIVWPGGDGGTTTPTALSNAFCGTTDTDCIAAADCTVTPDDGSGHSVLSFPCGSGEDFIGLVFNKGSSAPVEIYTMNLNGQ